ncbi:hypothetical protein KFK09_025252 [Dendrobium nobile]|uniref:Uncharacterized protein n=1 Tax=Dendrobium nobile TaxID=94219 RepID=A0A8T3ALJ3_DENNO|nr:hypothetical protein KFK09_025252 [Dendrobium nobile]
MTRKRQENPRIRSFRLTPYPSSRIEDENKAKKWLKNPTEKEGRRYEKEGKSKMESRDSIDGGSCGAAEERVGGENVVRRPSPEIA